jgi:predicted phage terminase large subunit-like protein
MLKPRLVDRYTIHTPHPVQQIALSLNNRELLFGGAAGGGKSDYLLMAALQYIDVPGYSALILRRTWPDLNSPNAILARFTEWMAPYINSKEVHRGDGGRLWTFPSGAKIQFGYASRENDKLKFQGAEYQFCGFDEGTQFEPSVYQYLLSRLRRPTIPCAICTLPMTRYYAASQVRYRHKTNNSACPNPLPDPGAVAQYPAAPDGTTIFDVPLRMRVTANPGGLSHMFFKERFLEQKHMDGNNNPIDAAFIPSALKDNPSIAQAEYEEMLAGLSVVDRERLLNGDWEIMDEGNFFNRGDFNFVDTAPADKDVVARARFWDLAATADKRADYTAGVKCSITTDGRWFIEDIQRIQSAPADIEKLVRATAIADGIDVKIYMEQELGSAGKSLVSHYARNVLPGFQYKGVRPTGKKEARAGSLVSQTSQHNVYVVKAGWNLAMLDEFSTFPSGMNDDMVDAASHCFTQLAGLHGKRRVRVIV